MDLLPRAGMRAPDHGALQPWRFIIIEGEGRTRLSELLSQSAMNAGMDPKGIEKAKQAPFRAPLLIACRRSMFDARRPRCVSQQMRKTQRPPA